ncbi:MAG: NAD(P)H-hydrate dehydratase [Planctomycetota bacterium]|nr:NAD(P)H-hydrate dehydratase [Planctomycetota bacterium]
MINGINFPPRPSDGHKGTFGSVCVIGGGRSEDGVVMVGAPALAANGAMRSGCGKSILAMPQPLVLSGLSLAPTSTGIELPVDEVGRLMPSFAIEALDSHAAGCRCLVIGPGMGCDWPQQQLVAALLSRDDRPIVLDADGLNALAQLESGNLEVRAPVILTPHIGEYRRLATSMKIDPDLEDRSSAAEALAQAYGCVVVLKSSSTFVSNGVTTTEIDCGGVVLATGGTGDVLAGIIAGLLVQFGLDCSKNLFDAAVLGVRIHAKAGEIFESKYGDVGLLATDLLEGIPNAISLLKKECSG